MILLSEMSSFTTFNQFDKRFSDFAKFGNDRTACPLFGILTCYNFMQNGDISTKQHENNIYAAVTNYMTNDVPKYMTFDELLLYSSSLNSHNVGATTPELITAGILGYEHMFKLGGSDADCRYCVLFLKNRNYIPVLCEYKKESNQFTYAVRDCHENTQKTFHAFDELRGFLDKTYQFEQMTVVDGVLIAEFSNIEYLVIDESFTIKNVDPELYDSTIEEEKEYVEEKKVVVSNNDFPPSNNDFDYQLALSLQQSMNDGGEDYVNFI